MQFTGKTVFVTGGTSGVGKETAKAFADRGGSVVLTGRDAQRGKDVVAEIQAASGTARADLAAQGPVRHG
jgi:short-subunit dehydrogenase involved in D-alanine esterification of teichoic acids